MLRKVYAALPWSLPISLLELYWSDVYILFTHCPMVFAIYLHAAYLSIMSYFSYVVALYTRFKNRTA